MIAFFRWIVSPCLFGHHESRVFERVNGHLVLVCPRCRNVRPILVTS